MLFWESLAVDPFSGSGWRMCGGKAIRLFGGEKLLIINNKHKWTAISVAAAQHDIHERSGRFSKHFKAEFLHLVSLIREFHLWCEPQRAHEETPDADGAVVLEGRSLTHFSCLRDELTDCRKRKWLTFVCFHHTQTIHTDILLNNLPSLAPNPAQAGNKKRGGGRPTACRQDSQWDCKYHRRKEVRLSDTGLFVLYSQSFNFCDTSVLHAVSAPSSVSQSALDYVLMSGGYLRGSESSGSSHFFILFPPHLLAPFVLLPETRGSVSAGARVEDVSIFLECFLSREESCWSEDAQVFPLWKSAELKVNI